MSNVCENCLKEKSKKKTTIEKNGKHENDLEFYADIFGPLPKSIEGKRFVLVFKDRKTKLTVPFCIPNKTGTTIAKCFNTL